MTHATDGISVHPLKCWPEYFRAILDGRKRFEVRRDDRGFALGDVLALLEYDPETNEYTRRTVWVRVIYIIRGDTMPPGLVCPGAVVMGIEICASFSEAFSREKDRRLS